MDLSNIVPAAPPAPDASPAAPVPADPWSVPAAPSPTAPAAPTPPPAAIEPVVITPPVGRKGPKAALIAVIVLVVLALAGAGFAAYKGWMPLPFLKKAPSLTTVVDALASLQSARVGLEAGVVLEPRAAETPAIDFRGDTEEKASLGESGMASEIVSGLLLQLPSDTSLSVKLSSDWSKSADLGEYEASFDGTYSAGSLSIGIGADLRKVGEYGYIKPTKLPSLFMDFSAVVGRWIRTGSFGAGALSSSIVKTEYVDYEEMMSGVTEKPVDPLKDRVSYAFEEYRLLLEKGTANGAYTVMSAEAVDLDGRKVWKLNLAFSPDKYREAFRTAHAERTARLPQVKEFSILTDDALSALDDKIAQKRVDAIAAAMKFDLYVDQDTGLPTKIEVGGTFAVDAKQAPALKDRQVKISSAITLSRANEPVIVAAPEEWISMASAAALLTGASEAQGVFAEQSANIDALREALDGYKKEKGSYPATLDALKGFAWYPNGRPIDPAASESEKPKEEDSSEDDLELSYSLYSDGKVSMMRKTVLAIPDDIYTSKPLSYSVTADGYQLKYDMRLIGVEEGSFFSKGSESYVEGENTATSDKLSVESSDPALRASREAARLAELQSGPDADGDGLSDLWEDEIGTDPNDKDTDGDGFEDKQEIDNGYSPVSNPTTPLAIARAKARDFKRVADIKQIQTALELYFADTGAYPSDSPVAADALGTKSAAQICGDGFRDGSRTCDSMTYMGLVPEAPEPVDGGCSRAQNSYQYAPSLDGKNYEITFCLGGQVGNLKPGMHTATWDGIN